MNLCAVGEYFNIIDRMLKPGGKAVIQAITYKDEYYKVRTVCMYACMHVSRRSHARNKYYKARTVCMYACMHACMCAIIQAITYIERILQSTYCMYACMHACMP